MIRYHFKQVLIATITIVFAISLAFFMGLFISPLIYHQFSERMGLDQLAGLSVRALTENFEVIIRYLIYPQINKLAQPYFSSSENGLIHFAEVKNWVTIMGVIFILSLLYLIGCHSYFKKLKYPYTYLYTLRLGQLIPIVLVVISLFAFEPLFVVFHRLLFNNELWYFDPLTDPVILVLPQSFFFVMMIFIGAIYELALLGINAILRRKLN